MMMQGVSSTVMTLGSLYRKRSERHSSRPAGSRGMAMMAVFRTPGTPLLSRKGMGVLLFCLVGLLSYPTVVNGAASSASGTPYYASNCYEVGGGNMGPPYLKCVGCKYVEAFECLEALRSNASANVPSGCGINTLTVQPDPACCPVFADPSSQSSVDGSTSGYPDTLLCLENAGCAGDKLHTALIAECKFNQCNEEFACAAVFSSSRRLAPVAEALALAWVGLMITTAGFGSVGWR